MEKSSGEEFLKKHGLLPRRSKMQRQVIGCIACQWSNPESEGAYGAQISKCTGLKSGTIGPILRRLERAQITTPIREDADPKVIDRPLRKYYTPADTGLGAAFVASLEKPSVCNLVEGTPDDATAPCEVNHPNRIGLATEIINTSSREELEQIIAQAQHQIAQLDNQ